MEILQLVDQLEQVLSRGYRLPLSGSLVVSEEECMRLIDQMRISVPSAIKESERMVAERDRILDQARAEAESIIQQARRHAHELVREDVVTEEARSEAERILAQSQGQAQKLVERGRDEANALILDAEEYAVEVLQRLVAQLTAAMQQATNGIAAVEESRRTPESATEHDVSDD